VSDNSFLSWPFFEDRHRALAAGLEDWAGAHLPVDHGDVDAGLPGAGGACLGAGGWLQHSAVRWRGEKLDVRSLCLIRETLARHDGLADFAFAMQGLGMGAVSPVRHAMCSSDWLARTRAGRAIAGFALTEPGSGSDVAATSDHRPRG
jgi:acyl-CoA dehydrogenase